MQSQMVADAARKIPKTGSIRTRAWIETGVGKALKRDANLSREQASQSKQQSRMIAAFGGIRASSRCELNVRAYRDAGEGRNGHRNPNTSFESWNVFVG
ncbi:hypothetical protein N2601_16935 [Rhizobium sp. CB3060]|uniref:hypothetical protein n=1 Tax=Rhizobium sp. CB3060 TaxID=3138255 RepID=UPI0021A3B152|nr:hypothetical protein [Rhizobium tropici]UWU20926.1 hypothetical protein N2601_16935 [Rhizobium tropici]